MARVLTQGLFVAVFVALAVTGKIRLWMAIFLLGVIVSAVWGRFYCGWVCPMHTAMRGIAWLKRKLRVKDVRTPAFMKKPGVRAAMAILFAGAFAFVMISGRQIPVLFILLGLSVVVTALFGESMWHRYLCPQGAILSVTARAGKNGLFIAPDCVRCGACAKACPAGAIVKKDRYAIEKHECIRCGNCEPLCKVKAIRNGREHP